MKPTHSPELLAEAVKAAAKVLAGGGAKQWEEIASAEVYNIIKHIDIKEKCRVSTAFNLVELATDPKG